MNDKVLQEGNCCFDFSCCIAAYKVDMPTYSGLLSVDFIVELEDKFLFIEVKNIDNPKTPAEERKEWIERLKIQKSNSFLFEMSVKFKDTILRKWANEESLDKPIWYIIVLQFAAIDAKSRIWLAENLSGHLPTCFTKKNGFKKTIKIKHWDILNVDDWKEKYPEFPLTEVI